MAIARFPGIVIDCADPSSLARFYGEMLGWKVDVSSGWAEVRTRRGTPSVSAWTDSSAQACFRSLGQIRTFPRRQVNLPLRQVH